MSPPGRSGREAPADARREPTWVYRPLSHVGVESIGALLDREPSLIADLGSLPPRAALLAVTHGPMTGMRFVVDRCTTLAGRHPECHLVIDDPAVSRRHAELRRCRDSLFVCTDKFSLNGTLVNGDRITVPRRLVHGDGIQIGGSRLVFLSGIGRIAKSAGR